MSLIEKPKLNEINQNVCVQGKKVLPLQTISAGLKKPDTKQVQTQTTNLTSDKGETEVEKSAPKEKKAASPPPPASDPGPYQPVYRPPVKKAPPSQEPEKPKEPVRPKESITYQWTNVQIENFPETITRIMFPETGQFEIHGQANATYTLQLKSGAKSVTTDAEGKYVLRRAELEGTESFEILKDGKKVGTVKLRWSKVGLETAEQPQATPKPEKEPKPAENPKKSEINFWLGEKPLTDKALTAKIARRFPEIENPENIGKILKADLVEVLAAHPEELELGKPVQIDLEKIVAKLDLKYPEMLVGDKKTARQEIVYNLLKELKIFTPADNPASKGKEHYLRAKALRAEYKYKEALAELRRAKKLTKSKRNQAYSDRLEAEIRKAQAEDQTKGDESDGTSQPD